MWLGTIQQHFPSSLTEIISEQYYCFKWSSWIGKAAVTLQGFVKGIRPAAPPCLIKKCRKPTHWQHGFLQNDLDLHYLCSHPPDPSKALHRTQETWRATEGVTRVFLITPYLMPSARIPRGLLQIPCYVKPNERTRIEPRISTKAHSPPGKSWWKPRNRTWANCYNAFVS